MPKRRRPPTYTVIFVLLCLLGALAPAASAATGGTTAPGAVSAPSSTSTSTTGESTTATGGSAPTSGAASASPSPLFTASPYPMGAKDWVFPLYQLARVAARNWWSLDQGVDLGATPTSAEHTSSSSRWRAARSSTRASTASATGRPCCSSTAALTPDATSTRPCVTRPRAGRRAQRRPTDRRRRLRDRRHLLGSPSRDRATAGGGEQPRRTAVGPGDIARNTLQPDLGVHRRSARQEGRSEPAQNAPQPRPPQLPRSGLRFPRSSTARACSSRLKLQGWRGGSLLQVSSQARRGCGRSGRGSRCSRTPGRGDMEQVPGWHRARDAARA